MEIKKMYIDGQWVLGSSGKTRNIINPATEEVLAAVTEGNADDVKLAAQAASRAFYDDGWRESKARVRAELLLRLADKLEESAEDFARLETLNNGKPISEARYDVADAVNQFRYYAGLATKPHGQVFDVPDDVQSIVVTEAVGVAAIITPWNYPLVMATQKIAAAIAAGCTVIVKPASVTPLTTIRLFELIDELEFPKGVLNLVIGPGSAIGNELSENPLIDKISFTGGTETGVVIAQKAAPTMKRLSLELGGKSPLVVFDDADFDVAVEYALFAIFANQGQVCSAGSRLILQETMYGRFVEELLKQVKKIKIGPGIEEHTLMGPLVSEEQRKTVESYVEIGLNEGATLLCGGKRIEGRGYFFEPTIFTDTTPDMRIVQEEIFGPVLVIQKFRAEEEAIRLANDTKFGLAGAVFTGDSARAMRVSRKIRAGIFWINTYHNTYNEAPWGGFKMSGIGRDLGTYGFQQFLEPKQINVKLHVSPAGWLPR
ncbi:betaine-aldehyde dehydrogenase [Gordoniibacillus kamchatkensis]|uniref:Betaine-aldehyde dehydrogenase n=1 Tax=Gordoniibacillus kamchatkensis TaxID=1590651 RepID=A0ABR5AGW8_9BACL|nr:aldehyde dehydrogenase family protein [Paenibacillus sp. VKM B-2647]KIL40221.1 betaine-aldehyde dehydrogenase [Paenibacillus sp. VKM B-2647]